MKKIWIASLVVAAVTVPATLPRTAVAQPADLADPDLAAVAESVRAEADAPALALAVIQPDGETRMAAAGLRCVGSRSEVTTGDLWHWGSITKSMTATLVARLAERGVVSWGQTIGELLGDAVPEMLDAYRDVTFVHLLSHRAGLQPNIPIVIFREFGQLSEDPAAERLRWARIALAQEPVGPMEETYAYSNNGYVVAGAMLEAATGKPWEELMRREVFEPLGMTDAGFGAPRAGGRDGQPCGHVPDDEGHRAMRGAADNPEPLGPAGRVHMPLADMAAYLAAHATRPADFLAAASWERLHTPPFGGDYALGWVAISPENRWHNGSNTMWYAEIIFALEGGRAAAVVVNDGAIQAVQPVVRKLLGELMRGAWPSRASSGDGRGRL